MYHNEINLIGYLGNDAEVHTSGDRTFTTFQLATQSSYKKDGKWIPQTEWHRCVVFGKKLAAFAAKLKKGEHFFVVGPYRSREYTSTKTDSDVRIWEVRVTSIKRLDRSEKTNPEEVEAHDDSNEEQAA